MNNNSTPPVGSRPTLATVARLAGVSNSTASLAFSGMGPVSDTTRARVFTAAKQLNYAGPDPRARSLRRGRSGIVGVVMEERVRDAFRDPITIALLDGIAEEIALIDAGLLIVADAGGAAERIEDAPMDAVVLIGCSPRLDDSVTILQRRRIPLVAIEGDSTDGFPTIGQDNREATRLAAQHLRDLGHRDAAVVTLPLTRDRIRGPLTAQSAQSHSSTTGTERLAGAHDVFPQAGGWVTGGSYVEEGRIAGIALLSDASRRPTAVIAQSDLLAAGVIRAAEELGLEVPGDVSVVGFDGIRVEGLWPYDLTTLVQPAVEKGRAAGRTIIEMLEGRPPQPLAFTSEFHRGNTTAQPRHKPMYAT